MPQVTMPSSKDVRPGQLIAKLRMDYDTGYGTPVRYVTRAVLASGESPSYGFLSTPMNDFSPGHWDEKMPAVALQADGPAGQIKLLTRASIAYAEGRSTISLLNGWLVTHSHQIGEDSLISQIFDDRFILGKYTTFGKMIYNPGRPNDPLNPIQYYWDLTAQMEFNAFGYQDCLDTPYGPRWAPAHRFGWSNHFNREDLAEPEAGEAIYRSRSWRVADALRVLRDMYYQQGGGVRPPLKVNVGQMDLPPEINWPESFGGVEGAERPLRGFTIQNYSLLSALQALARKAGAYDIYMQAEGAWNARLEMLDMNPKSFTGTILKTAKHARDVGDAMNSANIVQDGHVIESAINYFSSVCIMGDGPAVEGMCSMREGTGAFTLQPAWPDTDEWELKNFLQAYGNEQEVFSMAVKLWPLVYAAYRVTGAHNPWLGTKWNELNNGGYKRLKPQQLTGYQQDTQNPKNWIPREIIVEYYQDYRAENPDAPPEDPDHPITGWYEGTRLDNLSLSPDGTIIMLPGMRDALVSWTNVFRDAEHTPEHDPKHEYNNQYSGKFMFKRALRIQLAIEADWPLTGYRDDDPNGTAARVNQALSFTYQHVADPMDYVEYLRRGDSRPLGEVGFAKKAPWILTRFPAKCTEGNELFTDRVNATTGRLPEHALKHLRNFKRIEYNGLLTIARLAPGMRPGLNATLISGNSLPCYGVLKAVWLDMDMPGLGDATVIEFGPPEAAAIYDIPQKMQTAAYNEGMGAGPSAPPEDKYPDEPAPVATTAQVPYDQGGPETPQDNAGTPSGAAKPKTQEQGTAGQPPARPSEAATPKTRDKAIESAAGKAQKRLGNMQAALEKAQTRGDEGSERDSQKSIRGIEKDIRRQGKHAERLQGRATAAKARSAAEGTIGGRKMNFGDWLGKATSGSMRFGNGNEVRAGHLQDQAKSYLGRLSSGRYAKPVDLSSGAGVADTRRADQFAEAQSAAASEKRMRQDREFFPMASSKAGRGQMGPPAPGRMTNIGTALMGPPAPQGNKTPPAAPRGQQVDTALPGDKLSRRDEGE